MKKSLLTFTWVLIITFNIHAQTVPNYVPQTGLIGWLPFNGNANDISGNGNNGTLVKATLTTDRSGAANSAYDFDGFQNQYIMCTNANLPIGNSPRSFSMWLNAKGIVNSGWTLTALGYGAQTTNNSQSIGLYNNMVRYAGWLNECDINYTYNYNQWYHIVTTFDGVNAKIYVNGASIGSMNKSIWNTITTSKFFIGTRTDSLNSFFHGKIDDVGIWNRALSNSEVKVLFNAISPSPVPSYISRTNLLAWFPFTGNVTDESGNGNNLVSGSNSATLTTDNIGNANSAYMFDGDSGQFIKCINKSMPDGNSPRTFSMWFNYAGDVKPGESLTAFGYGQQSTANAQMLGLYQGKVRYMSWASDFDVTYTYTPNTWYHMLTTYDGNKAKMYINGVLLDSNTIAWHTINSNNLFIGTRPDTLNSFFNGKIDDIGVWGRVLTSAEIQMVYSRTNGITENFNETNLLVNLYPNPFNDQISLQLDQKLLGSTAQLMDIQGNLISEFDCAETLTSLNTTELGSGMYFIRFKDHPGLGRKLIKN